MSEQTGSALSQCDHGVEAWQCRTCVDAEMDYMRDRAERAERERDRLRERLEEAHLVRIEAQNPGIDMEQVRRGREVFRAAVSADADADAEPARASRGDPPDRSCPHCGATEGEWCEVDCPGKETEPSRAEGEHNYLSTACLHGQHERCRRVCKFCDAECRCSCGHPPDMSRADGEALGDGYTRAWQAMGRLLDDAEGDEVPVTELLQAALDSGGVVTREDWLEACDGELARANERDRVEGRLLALEAVIRDDIYPMIAGRVIELDHAGEDGARDQWNALCHRVLAALEVRDG